MNEREALTMDDVTTSKERIDALIGNIGKIIRGKETEIGKIVTALLAGGHVLLEDLPGLGKTSMAKALA